MRAPSRHRAGWRDPRRGRRTAARAAPGVRVRPSRRGGPSPRPSPSPSPRPSPAQGRADELAALGGSVGATVARIVRRPSKGTYGHERPGVSRASAPSQGLVSKYSDSLRERNTPPQVPSGICFHVDRESELFEAADETLGDLVLVTAKPTSVPSPGTTQLAVFHPTVSSPWVLNELVECHFDGVDAVTMPAPSAGAPAQPLRPCLQRPRAKKRLTPTPPGTREVVPIPLLKASSDVNGAFGQKRSPRTVETTRRPLPDSIRRNGRNPRLVGPRTPAILQAWRTRGAFASTSRPYARKCKRVPVRLRHHPRTTSK
jgi:hypothetical protein